MQQTEHSNKRSAFRMPASEFENGAGIAVGKKVIAAQLLDYSLEGCRLGFEETVSVEVGEKIRVATSKGQYWGVIRRIQTASADLKQVMGIEFVATIEESMKSSNSLGFMGSDPKHSVGGGFSLGFVMATLVAWGVVACVLYWIFRSQ